MAQQIVLLVNLIGLLLIELFSADLRIVQNVPSTMAAGSEVRVTITVNKGSLTGFAKLQLDLPPGMTATAIETKGASFTFADQKAKFIWMALPSSPTFKLSYTLSASPQASGNLPIMGRFSYIEDNERKTFDLPTTTVHVTGGVVAPVAEVTITDDMVGDELVSAASGAPVGTVPVAVIDRADGIAPMQGQGGVSCTRTITPVTEKEFIVEVTVKKGSLRGFGKVQETIPAGFTAAEKSNDEAIFTLQDRMVKFVWLNMPAKETVKVSYKLLANDNPDGEYRIDGEFGYLLNEETQKAVTGTSKFFIGPKAMEALRTEVAEVPVPTPAAPKTADPEVVDLPVVTTTPEPVATEEPARTQRASTGSVTSAPEKGVTYKVQVMAAHREVGRSYFVRHFNYSGPFSIERHEGWIKYVTGSFTEYKAARDQRVAYVQAGHNFPGPFVTAYNNGTRITVQEALLLTSQQWMP
jgi:hypothetical protein